jgi:hypothetical protein
VWIWVCAWIGMTEAANVPAAKMDVTKNSRLSNVGASGIELTMS